MPGSLLIVTNGLVGAVRSPPLQVVSFFRFDAYQNELGLISPEPGLSKNIPENPEVNGDS
jgi:hypothetical protein